MIEMYLDLTQLAQNQSLVILDQDEKPWDVSEALQDMGVANQSGQMPTKLVYERWNISLDDAPTAPQTASADTAPSIYKKGVVAIRSLYTYTKYLPAWRFGKRLGRQAGNGPMLRPRYRVVDASRPAPSANDTLTCPLYPSEELSSADTFNFAPLNCVFGSMKVAVSYRRNCEFLLEDTERLLSTKAMRSVRDPRRSTLSDQATQSIYASDAPVPGSYKRPSNLDRPAQVFGSERAESSPLKAAPASRRSIDTGSSRPFTQASIDRRPSVSFQPFKAGSLSSSPGAIGHSASPGSLGRGSSYLSSHARSRSSLTTLPQQALRTPQLTNEMAIASSGSSSPKPAPLQRYSSSFGNRKSRFPSSGNIKDGDDNLSSGRGSMSSAHRSSGVLPEAEGSSSSAHADDENIADFLKLLDKNKGLQSFNKTDQAATSQRTAAQYSKFHKMRDSTTQLTESMSSSLMLPRSSSSSSRQLHNVPGMVAGSSFSTSSSPGKPISPHTPHLPAIPSRLSNNSITADYTRETSRTRPVVTRAHDSADRLRTSRSHGTPGSTAIDIPTSPRTFPTGRRSSSVAQQARARTNLDEQEALPYGLRSASLPNEQGAELSLSELLTQGESGSVSGTGSRRRRDLAVAPAADDDDEPLLFALAE